MILIAGGAGYIGSHVNKLLNERGYRTLVFDNLSCGHRKFVKWGEFVLGDLADKAQIRLCFLKYPIKAVMHFSAHAYVGESVIDPAKYYRNNVSNTLNLLEVMREFNVSSFIFSSTCATYGNPGKTPITEDHPQRPINPYGKSKLIVEEILKDFDAAYGVKHVNLRYFNAAGADKDGEIGERHEPETHLIPLAIYAALGINDNVKIFGTDYPTNDGTCIRDYIHVTDLAEAHLRALEFLKDKNESGSFNIGTGEGMSVRELVNLVKEFSGRTFKIEEVERRPGDPPVLVASKKKAEEQLDWRPKRNKKEIVKSAWRWHKKNWEKGAYSLA